MLRKAIRSKHIYLNDQDDPCDGYLLIENEKIEKFLPYSSATPTQLSENYKLFDYSDCYIFPGLIDVNVHLNSTFEDQWNDSQNITKMAAQGGITTLIDNPLMHRFDENQANTVIQRIKSLNNKIFVDVGLLAYLDHNYLELLETSGVLGFKGYLSPPIQSSLPKLTLSTLYKIKKSLENIEYPCVFCIQCEEANNRDLFMPSPLRSLDKKMRIDLKVDIKDFRAFAGGHQGIMNDNDGSSNDSNCEEKNDKVYDLILEANRINNNNDGLNSPLTADLKITAFWQASNQDEKYISEQEYLQYKGGDKEEAKDYFEDGSKMLDSMNINQDSSLELSQEISDDFSNHNSLEHICLAEEAKEEEKLSIATKPSNLFSSNLLKEMVLSTFAQNDEYSSKDIQEKPNVSIFASKQELKQNDQLEDNAMLRSGYFDNYSNKQYSKSPEISQKKEGILARRMKVNIQTPSGQVEQLSETGARKKANTMDPKAFTMLHRIKTMKDVDNIENKEEEKIRCQTYKNYLFNHPLAWETSGVNLLLKVFGNITNCNILLTNFSSSSLAYIIRDEKKKNPALPFYVDTSIPYVFFNMDMIKNGQTKFKASPPIREKAEQKLIIKSLRKGVFDTVSSFHLQTPMSYKNIERGNFRRAFEGISCLGFNLPSVWTRLYLNERKIFKDKKNNFVELEKNLNKTFKMLIRTMSKRPAEIFKINHQKGDLLPGKDADILIWNPFVVKKIEREDILLKQPKLFVFRGYKVYGEVVATFLRGDIVFQKEKDGKDFIQRGRVLKRGFNI